MILSVLPLELITDQTINVPEGDVLMLSIYNGTDIIVSGKKKDPKSKKTLKGLKVFPHKISQKD